MTRLTHNFPPVSFFPSRVLHNEMGNFDFVTYEKAENNRIEQTAYSENGEPSQDIEQKYADAVRALEEELGVSGLEDKELSKQLKQIKAQEKYLTDVETLLLSQSELPRTFDFITVEHIEGDPIKVNQILASQGKDWNQLSLRLKEGQGAEHNARVNEVIESALNRIITEKIVVKVTANLTPQELLQFSTELKRQSELRELYQNEKNEGTFFSHDELESFVTENTPILLEAFKAKNDAIAKLPPLSTHKDSDDESLDAFVAEYIPTSEDGELVSWSELFDKLQDDIASDPDPELQRKKFESFLRHSKDTFGDSVDVQILEAIDTDRRFNQLSFLVATSTTVEQAKKLETALAQDKLTEYYCEVSGQSPTVIHEITSVKLQELQAKNSLSEAHPLDGAEDLIPVQPEVFFTRTGDRLSFQALEKWVFTGNAKIYESSDGTVTIKQSDETKVQIEKDQLFQQNPDVKVLVGEGAFIEEQNGKLLDLDKTVEKANNTLFVRYGLDAEEFIPGGLNSPVGQEVAQKLAGLFFFKEPSDQQSAENDNVFESLKSKTDTTQFKSLMSEFFGIVTDIQSGISAKNVKWQLKGFFQNNNLLTSTEVLKPADDLAWSSLREKLSSYLRT